MARHRGLHENLKTVVHELRNTLAPLTASCQLIVLDPGNSEQVRELAAVMSRQLDELRQLVDDVLETSRNSADGRAADVADPEPVGPAAAAEELPAFRLLVVDDEPSATHLLARVLEKLGQQVHVAQSGDEALALLPTLAADAVISDIGMPGLSGYELAARIRKLPLTRQPLLVAVTGYGQESDRRAALGAGFDRHLKKPVGLPELRGIIEALARR